MYFDVIEMTRAVSINLIGMTDLDAKIRHGYRYANGKKLKTTRAKAERPHHRVMH
jgi:hypothetical protein